MKVVYLFVLISGSLADLNFIKAGLCLIIIVFSMPRQVTDIKCQINIGTVDAWI